MNLQAVVSRFFPSAFQNLESHIIGPKSVRLVRSFGGLIPLTLKALKLIKINFDVIFAVENCTFNVSSIGSNVSFHIPRCNSRGN